MANPYRSHLARPLTLRQLQRLKNWHVAQRGAHPLEYEVWNGVLTVWVMGWTGWLPAYIFNAPVAYLFCVFGIFSTRIYIAWRTHARDAGYLGCEWLDLLGPDDAR